MAPPSITALAMAALVSLAACGDGARQAATQSPRPPPDLESRLVDFDAEDRSGSHRCGPYVVEWRNPDTPGGGRRASLEVREGSRTLLEAKAADEFELLFPQWCGDITGDGRVELVHYTFTGGANCCVRARVDTIGGRTLLKEDLGRPTPERPEQLDDTRALEIPAGTDLVGYFDFPTVVSPVLPRVFAFKGGRYVDATERYPEHIRKSLREALALLDEVQKDDAAGFEGIAATAMGAFGHYVLLNEEAEGLEEITSRVPDDVASWLTERADRIARAIRTGEPPEE